MRINLFRAHCDTLSHTVWYDYMLSTLSTVPTLSTVSTPSSMPTLSSMSTLSSMFTLSSVSILSTVSTPSNSVKYQLSALLNYRHF